MPKKNKNNNQKEQGRGGAQTTPSPKKKKEKEQGHGGRDQETAQTTPTPATPTTPPDKKKEQGREQGTDGAHDHEGSGFTEKVSWPSVVVLILGGAFCMFMAEPLWLVAVVGASWILHLHLRGIKQQERNKFMSQQQEQMIASLSKTIASHSKTIASLQQETEEKNQAEYVPMDDFRALEKEHRALEKEHRNQVAELRQKDTLMDEQLQALRSKFGRVISALGPAMDFAVFETAINLGFEELPLFHFENQFESQLRQNAKQLGLEILEVAFGVQQDHTFSWGGPFCQQRQQVTANELENFKRQIVLAVLHGLMGFVTACEAELIRGLRRVRGERNNLLHNGMFLDATVGRIDGDGGAVDFYTESQDQETRIVTMRRNVTQEMTDDLPTSVNDGVVKLYRAMQGKAIYPPLLRDTLKDALESFTQKEE